MGRRKETATIYFELRTLKRLRALSDRTRVPVAVYVRQAVEEWLERNESTLSPDASVSAEGPTAQPDTEGDGL